MKKNRIKKIALVSLLLFFVLAGGYLCIEPLYTPTAMVTPYQKLLLPTFIAHKGIVSGQYKGNSKAAIEEALSSAVGGIEVDVRLSKDKVPFLFHADSLENLSEKERPEEKTWSELEKLNLISLEEVFQLVGSSKFLFLDIKESALKDTGFADAIASLVDKYELYDTVVVESFNPVFLARLRLRTRDIMIMVDFVTDTQAQGEESQEQFDHIPWLLRQGFVQKQIRRILRPDVLGPRWNVDPEILRSLVQHGYPLISWTVDDSLISEKLFSIGVIGVESNNPLKLMGDVDSPTPQKVTDAGGTEGLVTKRIYVSKEEDVINAIQLANKYTLKISIAGRRHSMGGQSLLNGGILLDMLGFNQVTYNSEAKTVTAQAGATWKKIQRVLNKNGRSVKVMQSDNIFTVGGSVSVNVHGWQVGLPPVGSTVRSLKVALADGHIQKVSLQENPELFKAVIGGYGLFAVILEVELETVQNSLLQFSAEFMPIEQFEKTFAEKVTSNPKIELAYGRLSVDKDHLLQEAGLFWYERMNDSSDNRFEPERLVALKRAIFRTSEYTDVGKQLRWFFEKRAAKSNLGEQLPRNVAMNPDIHVLWPIKADYRDILHEYFIPKGKMIQFLEALRKLIMDRKIDLLNVTIREVRQDNLSRLPYADQDVFAFVMFFSQSDDTAGEVKMRDFTQALIEKAIELGGKFYLPYREHYTRDVLLSAYPRLPNWVQEKQKWDPKGIFSSEFYQNIQNLLRLP